MRTAKRVRDAEGGVSQCGEQRSTVALAKPVAARPAGERPKNNTIFVVSYYNSAAASSCLRLIFNGV